VTLKEIKIGGKPVKMGCSADTLRRYRIEFGRDLLADLQNLSKADLNVGFVECLAYTMAKQGDPELDMPIGDWLDQFGPLDVINASEEIMNLWGVNATSTSKAKKK